MKQKLISREQARAEAAAAGFTPLPLDHPIRGVVPVYNEEAEYDRRGLIAGSYPGGLTTDFD